MVWLTALNVLWIYIVTVYYTFFRLCVAGCSLWISRRRVSWRCIEVFQTSLFAERSFTSAPNQRPAWECIGKAKEKERAGAIRDADGTEQRTIWTTVFRWALQLWPKIVMMVNNSEDDRCIYTNQIVNTSCTKVAHWLSTVDSVWWWKQSAPTITFHYKDKVIQIGYR